MINFNNYKYIITDKDNDGLVSYSIVKTLYPHLQWIGIYDTINLHLFSEKYLNIFKKERDKIVGLDTNFKYIDTIDHHLLSNEYVENLKKTNKIHINENCEYLKSHNIKDSEVIFNKNPLNTPLLLLLHPEVNLLEKVPKESYGDFFKTMTLISDGVYTIINKYKNNFNNWFKYFDGNRFIKESEYDDLIKKSELLQPLIINNSLKKHLKYPLYLNKNNLKLLDNEKNSKFINDFVHNYNQGVSVLNAIYNREDIVNDLPFDLDLLTIRFNSIEVRDYENIINKKVNSNMISCAIVNRYTLRYTSNVIEYIKTHNDEKSAKDLRKTQKSWEENRKVENNIFTKTIEELLNIT